MRILLALVVLATACTAVGDSDAAVALRPCAVDANRPPAVEPLEDVPGDYTMTSFDGTEIRFHWYPGRRPPRGTKLPTVFIGSGWGSAGQTDIDRPELMQYLSVATLRARGYNVLTWDPRGFGRSGGTVQLDSERYEGRDVQRLIDWVATRPVALLDKAGDPRMGMVGVSYGGGIALVAAAQDCRIDALVPSSSFLSLGTNFDPAGTYKLGWAQTLVDGADGDSVNPRFATATRRAATVGSITPQQRRWLVSRGVGRGMADVTAPTLFVQGTVDTLLSLSDAVTGYRTLRRNGVPTAMIWMCGGHGVCRSPEGTAPVGDAALPASIAWLDRYVKRDRNATSVPGFEVIRADGSTYRAAQYPPRPGPTLHGEGKGSLALVRDGGSGPPPPTNGADAGKPAYSLNFTGSRATNAVDVTVPVEEAAWVLGHPTLRITYRGLARPSPRPARLFAQVIDDRTDEVVGHQVTPVPVVLDNQRHTATVALEPIAEQMEAGGSFTVQLTAVAGQLRPTSSRRLGRRRRGDGRAADRPGPAPLGMSSAPIRRSRFAG